MVVLAGDWQNSLMESIAQGQGPFWDSESDFHGYLSGL